MSYNAAMDLALYEPLIDSIARRTAEIVLAELRKDSATVKPRWVGIEGAAIRLGMTETALRQRKAAGQIPEGCWVKVGGSIRWDLEAIDQFMLSR